MPFLSSINTPEDVGSRRYRGRRLDISQTRPCTGTRARATFQLDLRGGQGLLLNIRMESNDAPSRHFLGLERLLSYALLYQGLGRKP